MNKNRGQALVEFVIIIPVLLIILLGIVDFGNIIYRKYALENTLDTVINLYENNKQVELEEFIDNENVKVKYEDDNEFVKIVLTKNINLITPLLNKFLNNPHEVKVERTIYHE